jgi:hypothetical protein
VPASPLLSKTSMRLFWGFGRIIDKYKMARHFDSTVSCRCRSAARSPSVKPRVPGRRGRCPADPDAAGQPVDPGDHEDVALLEEVEDGPEFLPALGGGAGSLLGLDRVAPVAPFKAVIWISRS